MSARKMKILVNGLRIRTRPSLTPSTIVGRLWAGQVVTVDQMQNTLGYRWQRLADGRGWFAESGWGYTYAAQVDEEGGAVVWDKRHIVVDASFWVKTIRPRFWCALEGKGVTGFIHRTTGKFGVVEPGAHDRIATARQFGMGLTGGYIWCDLTTPAHRAMEIVGRAVEAVRPREGVDVIALDVEHDPGNPGGRAKMREIVEAFAVALLDASEVHGFVPLLYSVSGLWNGIYAGAGLPDWLDDPRWRWWVAAPGKDGQPANVFNHAAMPRGWDDKRLMLWQYSWVGRLPGCPHNLDFSRLRK